METYDEFATTAVRRYFTHLFVLRAQRHLKTLATHYGWTAEQLQEYETRFIRAMEFVPVFIEPRRQITEPDTDSDTDSA
jgi:hypothetical protein